MTVITVVAPASPAPKEKEAPIRSFFDSLGYDIRFGAHAFDSERFLAGLDQDRADDLNKALCDDETDIVMCLRGGYGSPRLLDKLDYDKIKEKKKLLFGFSDNTAFQLALYHKCNMISFTGFNADCVTKPMGDLFLKSLNGALKQQPLKLTGLNTLTHGKSSGILIGGTLTLLTGLLGTPYMPDLTNKVLLVEDVHESPYKIDRMLNQLRLSGAFNHLNGVLLAKCADCIAKDAHDGDILTVFNDYFAHFNIPVFKDVAYGHDDNHLVLPIGQEVFLDADEGTIEFAPFNKQNKTPLTFNF